MTHKDFDSLKLFNEYDLKTLADLWGYQSYDAIRRGIVTPAGSNIIILFITLSHASEATKYTNSREGSVLHMCGELKHGNDDRIIANVNHPQDAFYLFLREEEKAPYKYYGPVTLTNAKRNITDPSLFDFKIHSLESRKTMKFFGFKISNPKATQLVTDVKTCKDSIIIDQINQLEDSLTVGSHVFISLGGDVVSWDKGLIGLATITKPKFDKGYDKNNPRNFKLGLKMEFVLPQVMKRNQFIYYLDAYDAAGIGPNTKGEQNQAIKALTEKQAIAIIRAMADNTPQLENKIRTLFGPEFSEKIFGKMLIMVPSNIAFGENVTEKSADPEAPKSAEVIEGSRVTGGQNILLYGVPGCGKSHTVKTEYCDDDQYMERVVFHPDYTYSDFVGQILPAINPETKQVEYRFSDGPFTRILNKANTDKQHMYYLIIEEINRGNAPAIFGDVFQLLDRKPNGESTYGITNLDIARAVLGRDDEKVTIPSNLTIIATMNTADQSIFTLDTAFKRRWQMRMIKNDILHSDLANVRILGENVTWGTFASKINELILAESTNAINNEDKRLGAYFVCQEDLELIDGAYNPAFAEKVLMYLWNDVFKYNREAVFAQEYAALDELIGAFETEKFNVFSIAFNTKDSDIHEN